MPLEPKVMWDKVKKSIKGKSNKEQIETLEAYLSEWPQFKGQYVDMKMKIIKMLDKLKTIEQTKSSRKKHVEDGRLFSIKRQGAARLALFGIPNTGKSTLFKNLTKKDVRIADYPFSTQDVNSGIYEFNNISIQLLDLPPITEHTNNQLTYGAQLFDFIKSMVEIICLVIDCSKDIGYQILVLLDELEKNKISVFNNNIVDSPTKKLIYKKGLVLLTKTDLFPSYQITVEEQGMLKKLTFCSINTKDELTHFQNTICLLLGMITVLARIPRSQELDPFSLPKGICVYDLANKIHKNLAENIKYGKIWGDSVKFPGQKVNKDHVLQNHDIVEIYT